MCLNHFDPTHSEIASVNKRLRDPTFDLSSCLPNDVRDVSETIPPWTCNAESDQTSDKTWPGCFTYRSDSTYLRVDLCMGTLIAALSHREGGNDLKKLLMPPSLEHGQIGEKM